jgi:hypothetical protein
MTQHIDTQRGFESKWYYLISTYDTNGEDLKRNTEVTGHPTVLYWKYSIHNISFNILRQT